MVTLFATAFAELILGLLVVPDGIVTLVEDVGSVEHDQLDAVFQSVLVPPTQVPIALTVIVLVVDVVPQEPPFVVSVSVMLPDSDAPAVYVAVDGFVALVQVPVPPVQVPPVAPPPTEPPI